MSSGESSTEKSSVMPPSPMWKPTFSPPKRRWTVPEKMCSPLWPCIRGNLSAQSTVPSTALPGSSGSGRMWYMVSSASRSAIMGRPFRLPESGSCPPPPGKTAVRSSTTQHAPFSGAQDTTRAVKARHSPSE